MKYASMFHVEKILRPYFTLDDNNSKAIKRFDSESIKEKIC